MRLGFNRVNFIQDIINNKFNGNITKCATELSLSHSYLHAVIYDTKNKGGVKLLNSIINYCAKNKIDYHKYIFINRRNK